MPLIEWNETLLVGVNAIDEQHRKYVSVLNLFHDAVQTNKDREVIDQVLKELKQYVNTHFKIEESYMKMHNYPDIETHIREHQEAVNKVNKFIMEYERKEKDITTDLLKFMTDLFLNHILKTDRKYVPFVHGKV